MRHLIRQRLLQRTLRHARIIQIAKAAAHTRRALARFLRELPLTRGKRGQRRLWRSSGLGLCG